MAEQLNIDSPGAAQTRVGDKAQAPVDEAKSELDRLKTLARSRGAKNLSDAQLENIIKRKKSGLKHRAKIEQSRTEFETKGAKESLKQKANLHQTKAGEAAGTKGAKSAIDGLTAEARRSIASDPDAGPKLPPAMGKPTSPEQAKKLLDGMVQHLVMPDGEPFDLEAYAKTLRKQPPSKAKSSDAEPGTKRAGQKTGGSALGRASSAMGRGSRLSAAERTGPGAPRPGASPRLGQAGGALGAKGTNAATMSLSSIQGSSGKLASSNSAFNAGGGLSSTTSFDGMNFNWDGFFSVFLIKSQKDMAKWKKALRELRRLQHQNELLAHQIGIKLLEMRQKFERSKAMGDFAKKAGKAFKTFDQAKAEAPAKQVGGENGTPQARKDANEKLRGALKNEEGLRVRQFLTDGELQTLDENGNTEAREAMEELKKAGGTAELLARAELDLEAMPEGAPGRKALEDQKDTLQKEHDEASAAHANDPRTRDALRARRGKEARSKNRDELVAQRKELLGKSERTPAEQKQLAKITDQLREDGRQQKIDKTIDDTRQNKDTAPDDPKTNEHEKSGLEKAEDIISALDDAFASVVQSSSVEAEKMAGGARAMALKGRKETNALLRQSAAKTQGLINQLVQVLGMSRRG